VKGQVVYSSSNKMVLGLNETVQLLYADARLRGSHDLTTNSPDSSPMDSGNDYRNVFTTSQFVT